MNLFSVVRARLHKVHADHRVIARNMAWIIVFVFLGKLAGAAKEMAIANRYGISEDVDAYLFIFNLVSWPISVWFSVLTVVLVPLAARIRNQTATDLPRFRSELFGLTLLLGIGLMIIAWVGLPLLLRSQWTGLTPTSILIATNIVSTMALLAPLGVLISLSSAWMLSAGRQANTLLESIPALVLLAALTIFPGSGVQPLVWGTVFGFVLHLIGLVYPLTKRGEIEPPKFTRHSPQWPAFWNGFGIMVAGQALMSFIGVIDQFFAAHLGAGAISMLSYSNRILALALGLGATAVSRATLPIFSHSHAQAKKIDHIVIHWAQLLFIFGLLAIILGWWLTPIAVKLLFERGAFLSRDTEMVAELVRFGLIQMPFYFSSMVWVTYAASQRRYTLLFLTGIFGVLSKMIFNLLLIPLFGIKGMLLAWSIVYSLNAAFLWLNLRVIR